MTTTTQSPKKKGRPPSATLIQSHPEIAAQLLDQSLATVLSRGSDRSVEWQCELGHIWLAKVYNRTNANKPTGCAVCNGKKVLAGFNDVATTHPEVAALFADQAHAHTVTAFSNTPVLMRCLIDPAHEWKSPPSRIAGGKGGCPSCSGRISIVGKTDLATTHPLIAAMLVDQSLATTLKAGSNTPVQWQCAVAPSHTWITDPYSLTGKGNGCPVCSGRVREIGINDLATTHPLIAAQLVDQSLATTLSAGSEAYDTQWQCPQYEDHTWFATPHYRTNNDSDCLICNNKIVKVGFNDLPTTHPGLAAELVDPAQGHTVTYGSGTYLNWQCQVKPEHTWNAPAYRRTGLNPTGCPQCFGPLPSRGEKTLAQAITDLMTPDTVLTSDQSILPGRHELDIVVPSHNVAIEFNGVYWHSEASGKAKNYHAVKSAAAMTAGYQLIHVWEDDWVQRPEAVLRAIAHKLHATDRVLTVLPGANHKIAERAYLKSLTLGETRGQEAAAFLEANHIQGTVSANRHFVLRDADNDIRAMLSLRSPRGNARMNRGAGVWEIQRYATMGIVPGGFTKLLKTAERALLAEGTELTQWISFSSGDVSDGGMYFAANFTAEAQLPADYKYVGNSTQWRRVPKEAYQLKKFRENPGLVYENGWSEREAAQANGLLRIYDSGKTRWVKAV